MTFETVDRPSWFGTIRVPRTGNPEFEQTRPRARFRGRRRYYRTLRQSAERFFVQPADWYDYMHWHVDWNGMGNVRWRERREHLAALFTMFSRLLAETNGWTTPHQAWLQIDAFDGANDAVYLHTANPNAENFPNQFAGIAWDAAVPDRLREFVNDPAWQFGRVDHYWTHFVVRPPPAA